MYSDDGVVVTEMVTMLSEVILLVRLVSEVCAPLVVVLAVVVIVALVVVTEAVVRFSEGIHKVAVVVGTLVSVALAVLIVVSKVVETSIRDGNKLLVSVVLEVLIVPVVLLIHVILVTVMVV